MSIALAIKCCYDMNISCTVETPRVPSTEPLGQAKNHWFLYIIISNMALMWLIDADINANSKKHKRIVTSEKSNYKTVCHRDKMRR